MPDPSPSPGSVPEPSPESFAAEGERLAARGRAIEEEMTAVLADAFAAVLADPAELAALHPASARDAVDFLVRVGRMTRDEGEAVVRRAGVAPSPASGA
ncbi:MAG TPA: hypothetical protein VGD56_09535 [Gemmatirosa sp.]